MMSKRFALCAVIAAALLPAGVRAGTTTAFFDFESEAVTPSGADLSSLSVTDNGVTLTIDRAGQPFTVTDLSAMSGTAPFGSRSLSPTPPGSSFFNVNFSQPVSSFSAQMGDFGVGITDDLAITAFSGPNGTGTNLGTASATLPLLDSSTMAFKTVQISAVNIGSVELIGGTPGDPNSVFYDNFGVTVAGSGGGPSAVPLPPALLVAPLGALAAWYGARRLRTVAA
jgi:hypothetical protein